MSKYDLFPSNPSTQALTVITALALALTIPGCAKDSQMSAGECSDVKVVNVKLGDTYSQLVLDNTEFADKYTASQINDILHATYLAHDQNGMGKLPDSFSIPVGQIGVRPPGVVAESTEEVPGKCELYSNKST